MPLSRLSTGSSRTDGLPNAYCCVAANECFSPANSPDCDPGQREYDCTSPAVPPADAGACTGSLWKPNLQLYCCETSSADAGL